MSTLLAPPAQAPADRPAPRVVITHDFMEIYGGAERVTAELAATFPEAPVIALLGRDDVARRMGVEDRFTSLIAPREPTLRHYRYGAPLWGTYADRVRLEEADVVLASSYGYAHRLRTHNRAPTVCYCHSPLRFAWSMTEHYRKRWAPSGVRGRAFDAFAAGMRRADLRAATRVDRYLTQSPFTAGQIERFYGRQADIIGCPVDCDRFRPAATPGQGGYYLMVSRLIEPYKRVGVAMEAFRRMPGERLLIAGDGPAFAELKAAAPPNVTLLGALEDEPLIELMQGCRAAVFPSRDDFGLVPVEVMACGRPVIAYAAGGALHTVKPGLSGHLFSAQTPESLMDAVRTFDPDSLDPAAIRAHAMQWDRAAFRDALVAAVYSAVDPAATVDIRP